MSAIPRVAQIKLGKLISRLNFSIGKPVNLEEDTLKTPKDDSETVKPEKAIYKPSIVNIMPLKSSINRRTMSSKNIVQRQKQVDQNYSTLSTNHFQNWNPEKERRNKKRSTKIVSKGKPP